MSMIRWRAVVADEPGALCRPSCAIARCGGSILGTAAHVFQAGLVGLNAVAARPSG